MSLFSIYAPNFNLAHTLECGQVFRWNRIAPDRYEGVVDNAILRIHQKGSRLFVEISNSKISPAFIKSYFDLTLDLPYIYNTIGKDNNIITALRRFRGLRIIRQPVWECLASFIISAYNNIPRIKGIVYSISECFGRRLILDGTINYSFPSAEAVADSTACQLNRCGAGFRVPFLKKAAKAVLEKKVNAQVLRNEPYARAKEILMRVEGVGNKVADCVLLYSVGKFEAFPVDVWIKRIMEKFYFNGKNTSENKIREFATNYFGEYAGYAQQYLYHYWRTKLRIKRD